MAYCPTPSFEIPRPPVEAPLHGLLDAAYVPDLSGISDEERDRWFSGITFLPNPPTCGHVIPWLSGTDDPADKPDPDTNVSYSTYYSYVLTYSTICQVVPGRGVKEAVDIAKAALDAGTGQAVEAVFWGAGAGNPLEELDDLGNFSLTGSTPITTGYAGNCNGIVNRNPMSSGITVLSPKQAILSLSQALANCALGARGMIHAPVYLVDDWFEQGLIIHSDPSDPTSTFITPSRGDYVVAGSGYSGAGPAEHDLATPEDGYLWAYATGPVGVLLSDPVEKETTLIDHVTNTHRVIVERYVAIAANDTCLFGAYVDAA